jgi:hypothetical protein
MSSFLRYLEGTPLLANFGGQSDGERQTLKRWLVPLTIIAQVFDMQAFQDDLMSIAWHTLIDRKETWDEGLIMDMVDVTSCAGNPLRRLLFQSHLPRLQTGKSVKTEKLMKQPQSSEFFENLGQLCKKPVDTEQFLEMPED